MLDRTILMTGLGAALVAAALIWVLVGRPAMALDGLRQAYATPASPPDGPMRVFHLGHSLVGRDMPAMLAQLAGAGHGYDSQLGWGTSLKQHWEPGEAIKGFGTENAHPRHRPAKPAVGSGDYDAVILTEMVELRDAIKYHQSGTYLARWAGLARKANPETRVYLYETWHRLDDPEGWLTRLDRDLERYWIKKLLAPEFAANRPDRPVYLIPAGQVMAEFVRRLEVRDRREGIRAREDLFRRDESGALDTIHVNDLGAYLVALTHYAVLYQASPLGLPHDLARADGTRADAPTQDIARLMQDTVWDVVRRHEETGVPQ